MSHSWLTIDESTFAIKQSEIEEKGIRELSGAFGNFLSAAL